MNIIIRSALATSLSFLILAAKANAAPPATPPLVPFSVSFNHFDHHWFEWMPNNRKYEAIEAMVSDASDGSHGIIVFETERAAPKRQVFYTNDRAFAATGFALYRDISYQVDGTATAPLSMHVHLLDRDGAPVDWSISFASGSALESKYAGLTNQSGHSGSRLFMLFYREKDAITTDNHLTIGSTDYTLSPAQIAKLPFGPAYHSNVFIATLPYGSEHVAIPDAGHFNLGNEVYAKTQNPDGSIDWHARPYPGHAVTLHLVNGGIRTYAVESYGHRFAVTFSSALTPRPGATCSFSFSFDAFTNLMHGTIAVAGSNSAPRVVWIIDSAWAKNRRLVTEYSGLTPSGYTFDFKTLP